MGLAFLSVPASAQDIYVNLGIDTRLQYCGGVSGQCTLLPSCPDGTHPVFGSTTHTGGDSGRTIVKVFYTCTDNWSVPVGQPPTFTAPVAGPTGGAPAGGGPTGPTSPASPAPPAIGNDIVSEISNILDVTRNADALTSSNASPGNTKAENLTASGQLVTGSILYSLRGAGVLAATQVAVGALVRGVVWVRNLGGAEIYSAPPSINPRFVAPANGPALDRYASNAWNPATHAAMRERFFSSNADVTYLTPPRSYPVQPNPLAFNRDQRWLQWKAEQLVAYRAFEPYYVGGVNVPGGANLTTVPSRLLGPGPGAYQLP